MTIEQLKRDPDLLQRLRRFAGLVQSNDEHKTMARRVEMLTSAANYIEQLEGQLSAAMSGWKQNVEELKTQLSAQIAQPNQPSLTITLRQAEELVKFFGGHDCAVTVTGPLSAWGKTEPGLYAYCTEYPEEGASYLGNTEVNDDLAMHGRKIQTEQPSLSDADIWYYAEELAADCQPNRIVFAKADLNAFARALLSAQRQDSDKDPMDWPLPCDVFVGHGTFKKGVKLRSLVARMKVLYLMATGRDADEVAAKNSTDIANGAPK